jgi:hypothetical protein
MMKWEAYRICVRDSHHRESVVVGINSFMFATYFAEGTGREITRLETLTVTL